MIILSPLDGLLSDFLFSTDGHLKALTLCTASWSTSLSWTLVTSQWRTGQEWHAILNATIPSFKALWSFTGQTRWHTLPPLSPSCCRTLANLSSWRDLRYTLSRKILQVYNPICLIATSIHYLSLCTLHSSGVHYKWAEEVELYMIYMVL